MNRVSLAAILICLVLPSHLLGQGVELVNFFQDFTETQGANGISYVGLPSELGDNPPPLTFNAGVAFANGNQTFDGPGFFGPGGFPHVQQELSREFLALHPTQSRGVSIQYTIETTGSIRVSCDFARANDFQNAGDGVSVGIYLNDLSTPVFETSISSDHSVDATVDGDVFAGTGSVSYDQTICVQENDVLLFAVFAGDNSDAGFDITAFRGTVSSVPETMVLSELVNFFEDFSETQGDNGITYAGLPSLSGDISPLLISNPGVAFANGNQSFDGPGHFGPGGFPHVQQELSREFLALHPNSSNGTSIQYTVETTGCIRVSCDFARANDFQNAGDGVSVGIFLNDLDTPIFEASISSDHEVDATVGGDVFAGTGSVSFDETINVQENDLLLFAVFAGENTEAGFDVTAFRGTISAVTELILGDVNQDGVVDFSDIPAFIAVLQAGTFLEEADTNSDGEVNFADIPVFIAILSAS